MEGEEEEVNGKLRSPFKSPFSPLLLLFPFQISDLSKSNYSTRQGKRNGEMEQKGEEEKEEEGGRGRRESAITKRRQRRERRGNFHFSFFLIPLVLVGRFWSVVFLPPNYIFPPILSSFPDKGERWLRRRRSRSSSVVPLEREDAFWAHLWHISFLFFSSSDHNSRKTGPAEVYGT